MKSLTIIFISIFALMNMSSLAVAEESFWGQVKDSGKAVGKVATKGWESSKDERNEVGHATKKDGKSTGKAVGKTAKKGWKSTKDERKDLGKQLGKTAKHGWKNVKGLFD